ncbi:hypothetical protein BDY19DRAFT_998865 [Irpex rosettiformis]|uniref:Uncharacterized protein n=1 Tax=Irpex rosettiformis TaxID=378272 RepID=A0ACB8TM74_9APHY|nr:hypothetical protein BDY19DRAFT_998865 [Irpex rosettiformis]
MQHIGHATWDRTCPTFLRKRAELSTRIPESNYRYFPVAGDSTTWETFPEGCKPISEPLPPSPSRRWSDEEEYDTMGNIHDQDLERNYQASAYPLTRYTQTTLPFQRNRGHQPQSNNTQDKEQAEELDKKWKRKAKYRIYSDGSDIEGSVGAAAVMYIKQKRKERKTVLRYYLGTSEQHTVYEAELVGLLLALHLLKQVCTRIAGTAVIALDNKAAILAARLPKSGPAHYLLDEFHKALLSLKAQHNDLNLTVRWVLGHVGIDGNEEADIEAKLAAHNHSSKREDLPCILRSTLPQSASKLKQLKNAQLKTDAERLWKASRRYSKIARIDPSLPSDQFIRLTQSLPRKHAALLFRLCTKQVPLNLVLHRMKRAPSPICPACEEAPETIEHYLLHCPAYERARTVLTIEIWRLARSIPTLLNCAKTMRPFFKYIHETRRFTRALGNLTVPSTKETR